MRKAPLVVLCLVTAAAGAAGLAFVLRPAPQPDVPSPAAEGAPAWILETRDGRCPALPQLSLDGVCAVGDSGAVKSMSLAREVAASRARAELAHQLQWRIDRKKDPAAPRPQAVALTLTGTRIVATTFRDGRAYALVHLEREEAQRIIDAP